MGRYFLPIDHGRPDKLFVNDAPILVLGNIAFCQLQPIEKHGLYRFTEHFLVKLNRAS